MECTLFICMDKHHKKYLKNNISNYNFLNVIVIIIVKYYKTTKNILRYIKTKIKIGNSLNIESH